MERRDYKEIMDRFYAGVADFMSEMPEVMGELTHEERYFMKLDMPDAERRAIVFDWYLFDYKSEALSKNLLRYYIEKAVMDEDLKDIYGRFTEGIFSIFEVKTLRIGKEMIVRDLATGKEYGVKDAAITARVSKGQCGFLRLLPFEDYYILTGMAYFFPRKGSDLIKLYFMNTEKKKKPARMTPLMIHEIFSAGKIVKLLPDDEHFFQLCRKSGLEEDCINETMEKMKSEALRKGDYSEVQKKLLAGIKPYPGFDIEEFGRAFMALWNSFISQQEGFVEKGPVERALIDVSMDYLQAKVDPKRFKDVNRASEKAEKLLEEWLRKPRQELDGKTPEEVIIEERRRLGNPEERVKFRINFSLLAPGEEVLKKVEETVNRATRLLGENKPAEAIEAYKEYNSHNDQNHIVWHNMGVAYILLLDRNNAVKCFKKALAINPDYELARRNLDTINNATQKDIERMSREYRVRMVNQGKTMGMP